MTRSSRQASQARLPSHNRRNQHGARPSPKRSSRHATVYDAVAGRVSTQGFIPSESFIPSTRDTPSSSTLPIPPDEVLFRSVNAPPRYEENDIYWQDRFLRPDQKLPESDLLKALHTYAADLYGRSLGPEADVSYESLDGSALIALGVLMEEACKEALGETGDLALVEGEEVDEPERSAHASRRTYENDEQDRENASAIEGSDEDTQTSQNEAGQGLSRQKRRKVRHDSSDEER